MVFRKAFTFAVLLGMLLAGFTLNLSAATPGAPSDIKTEYLVNPIGLDTSTPRFSWICSQSDRGSVQTAYQVIVASSAANINSNIGDLWDSGKVFSNAQNEIVYMGSALVKRTGYFWKVRVWDQNGVSSAYSSSGSFETGMLAQSDWTAQWIGGDFNLLRDDLVLTSGKTVAKARLYVTSLGYNEVYINGNKVGTGVCNPTFTRYERRALYTTYDVTAMMTAQNAVGIMLGDAYYRRWVSNNLAARLELWVNYTDGTTSYFGTHSTTFKATKGGPITYNDIWNGERYDARLEASIAGWSNYGFNDAAWVSPAVISYNGIIAAQRQQIKVTEEITPVSISPGVDTGPAGYTWIALEHDTVFLPANSEVAFGANGQFTFRPGVVSGNFAFETSNFPNDPIYGTLKSGYYKSPSSAPTKVSVVDMGVNMVGWLKITVSGAAGTKIRLRFAENKRSDGTLETTDLRSAQAMDTYTLKGTGTEVWEPRFTHHGFRYVEVVGFTPTTDNIKGRVIHSDYPTENSFSSSNALINDIYGMYRRSQLGNTVGIPTDCPQRDERQGWGGDAVVTSEAACLSFDMTQFYESWFDTIDDCQAADGGIPGTNPDYFETANRDTVWMSTRVLIPWDLYMATGDKGALAKHYAKMQLYINYLKSIAGSDNLGTPFTWGDWVPAGATEEPAFFADAYYYQNVVVMSKIAAVLGNTADQASYAALADNIKTSFNGTYFKNSVYGANTQAGSAVALAFGLVPDDAQTTVLNNLVKDIVLNNSNHLTTGILGSKSLMEALRNGNRSDIAYLLMTQTTYPSWGYMFNKGPGTIWERWNSDSAIGSGMNSYNHVMYGGGPAAWVYKGLAGIEPSQAGYTEVLVKPEIVGDVTSANASVKTPKGPVSVNWTKVSNSQVVLNVTVPVNMKAVVHVPTLGNTDAIVSEGGIQVWNNGSIGNTVAGVTLFSSSSTAIVFKVGSGSYSFTMIGSGSVGGPVGYTLCASEGGSFTLPGTCDVAYGANGHYNFLNGKTGTISFDNTTFGGDPIFNIAKKGYYKLSSAAPAGYTYCANEDASFALNGTCDLAYGANGVFNYLPGQSGTVTFNNATFGGDPTPYTAKKGYYKISSAVPAGFVWCAKEGDSFTLPGLSDVAYGANGHFNILTDKTGTIVFNNDSFPPDPIPNVVKAGYYKLKTAVASPGLIEAESYSTMSGVQIEACTDTGGGSDVGYIDSTDWMVYPINIATAGNYTVQYRVASLAGGGVITPNLDANAIVLPTINVPNTGGWTSWTTISQNVNLPVGAHNFGVYASTGGWNLNWLSITYNGPSQ